MPQHMQIPRAYLDPPANTLIDRMNTEHPSHRLSKPSGSFTSVLEVINECDVENSPRYAPRKEGNRRLTFCNVYACDVCYLLGAYLPAVWWKREALKRLMRGEAVPNKEQNIDYLNVNGIYGWLEEFGNEFGWQSLPDASTAQNEANAGKLVVIIASKQRDSRHGHISIVVPETSMTRRVIQPGNVIPVQSQAGAKNYRMSTAMGAWWLKDVYTGYGFWKTAIGSPDSDH